MKILDVKCDVLRIPGKVFKRRNGLPDQPEDKEALLLRIISDEERGGRRLEGFCIWDRNGRVMSAVVDRHVRPLLLGQDPLNYTRIWYSLWDMERVEYFPKYIIGVVDMALWDLVGKILGSPVYRLAGGYRNEIPVYASTISFERVDEYRELVESSLQKGYKAIKLHGPGIAEQDVELCRKAREWVGAGFPLMFDATGGYGYEEALRVGRELERLDYLWYEEPLRDSHHYLLRKMAQKLDIPLLVAESTAESFYDTANQILGSTGVMIHGDPFIKAGITGVIKQASLCEAFGMHYQLHHSESYGLHAACAIRNTLYYEQIVPEDILHFDVEKEQVAVSPEGTMTCPERPGFGVELDWKKVEEYATITAGGTR
jgi:L-alanine-DL-glutamate epimerase-like enolase superfamily enzyme